MSGDVQPRKRKDKRRRKDDLSVEEPRGTAAVFGEGDVFMHSQHEHGTGGHWCAKVIFFFLLAVLVTLIGLIILENRGLSELEANAVESRYSSVFEGWLEDTPDDHHDEHTLELKHHDEEDDEHGDITDEEHDDHTIEDDDEQTDDADEDDDETGESVDELDEDDDDESHNDDEDDNNDSQDNDDDNEDWDQDNNGDQNIDSAENEEDEDERNFRKYYENVKEQHDEDEDDDDNYNDDRSDGIEDDENDDEQDNSNEDDESNLDEDNDDSNNEEDENYHQLDDDNDDDQRDYDESKEYEESYATHQNEEEGDVDLEEDVGVEVEKIEKEISDEDVLEEAAASNVEEEDKSAEQSDEETAEEDQTVNEEDFLESEDIEEPVVVERITAPAGKPLPEVEEGTSSEKPPDTLAEEEEYEKQQEELRRQKEQASHVWLKMAVGGALLVATHAVIRRATAPRDPSLSAEHANREESPSAIDSRMTLIPEEPSIVTEEPEEIPPPRIVKEVEKQSTVTAQSIPFPSEKNDEEEDEELDFETKNVETTELDDDDEDKELYSDDEIEEEGEQEVEVQKEDPKQNVPESKDKYKEPKTIEPEVEPDEEVPEDVEIIDDEQLEEELVEEEEEDEEDISDVDDAELLSRLEAKYGRLPEPERPAPKKDGGNSLEDEWPGEPNDQYWRQQLDEAERELRQGSWSAAEQRASATELRGSARARFVRARALDAAAEARRDNRLLSQSIAAYLELLKMNERLSDKILLEITNRTLDRIRFRGNYINAEPVYRLLIRRFPDDPIHRNNLSIAFLMANRPDLAEEVLKETLGRWPDDRIALAHLGFILKTSHNKLEEAVDAMRKALYGDIGAANEPRFYFHLGDALLLLGRFEEANEVHKRGAKLGHFLSPAQRSLYNVERLKSRPWWDIEQTPYLRLAHALEASWQTILKEGEAARALYEQEKEGLKERGEWSQLDLFVRGQELPGRCKKAPITCSIVRQELAAVGCKRGQIKFSAMEAGTHVRPHVGPTNCRLRMHLGLSNTKDTYLRVDKETRQWQAGKVLMFDDSFEHEVWHNGTGSRLVLIVDVWHPDLTHAERRTLPAI